MDNSHPRFRDKLENVEKQGFSYKETSIPTQEGEFLWSQIREHKYTNTIEIGCALGIASLYICEALSEFENPSHTIIDPYQTTQWKSIGVKNLKNFRFHFFSLIEKPSEIALPQLLDKKDTFDFAFIDGWHTFDHTLLDFFYLNRLIQVGGMIVFDDTKYPSVARAIRYIAKYPNYRLVTDRNAYRPGGIRTRLLTLGLNAGQYLSRVFPLQIRRFVFSDVMLSRHPLHNVLLNHPRWLAFCKTAEDTRNFDWYENF